MTKFFAILTLLALGIGIGFTSSTALAAKENYQLLAAFLGGMFAMLLAVLVFYFLTERIVAKP